MSGTGIGSALAALLLVLGLAAPLPAAAQEYSLRFFGGGVAAPDADRVKIRIDDETLPADPGPPADVGATDFTIEFWMKATAAENTAPAIACGANYEWIYGNIVFDRDRFNQGRAFGISIGAGLLVFGVQNDANVSETLCGVSNVLDGQWHHVAFERRASDGRMWISVDGAMDSTALGPLGDLSYPDDGVPGNYCGGPCVLSDPFIVIAAEKHDAGAEFPSYSGFVDELRLSNSLRYSGSSYSVPAAPFTADASTAALYRFDEGPVGACSGTTLDSSGAAGGPSDGECRLGGSPQGPLYSADTPFALPPAVPLLAPPWAGGALAASGGALLALGSAVLRGRRSG